jgi:hypothetical protein
MSNGSFSGQVTIQKSDRPQNVTITLNGDKADISIGGGGRDGDLVLRDGAGTERIRLRSRLEILTPGEPVLPAARRILLDGQSGTITIGGNDANGGMNLLNATGTATVQISGQLGNIRLGGNNADGDIELLDFEGKTRIHLDAGRGGPVSPDTKVYVDGVNGDVILQNADCAEDFDLAESEEIEPGTVMVLDRAGKLQPSKQAYDKKVAGIISGAGDYRPGIVLGRKPGHPGRIPLALVGRVFCKADAECSAIEAGDLLTTSSTPGHAMKATDPVRAFGAVIGKALRPLKAGQGLIPVLIALQ